jgi:MarR family transcriptional regulator, organic hydroperoxide resistance regulator
MPAHTSTRRRTPAGQGRRRAAAAPAPAGDPDISEYLAYLLASANRRMRQGLAQTIAAEDVTEEQWRVLQVLSDEQGRPMGDLAEQVLMNHPALTKNIDKLVSRGLVQRAADQRDSRRVLVYISDLGLERVARLKPRIDAHHHALEDALGSRKSEQLKKLLQAFISESG